MRCIGANGPVRGGSWAFGPAWGRRRGSCRMSCGSARSRCCRSANGATSRRSWASARAWPAGDTASDHRSTAWAAPDQSASLGRCSPNAPATNAPGVRPRNSARSPSRSGSPAQRAPRPTDSTRARYPDRETPVQGPHPRNGQVPELVSEASRCHRHWPAAWSARLARLARCHQRNNPQTVCTARAPPVGLTMGRWSAPAGDSRRSAPRRHADGLPTCTTGHSGPPFYDTT